MSRAETRRRWIGSVSVIGAVVVVAGGLTLWKSAAIAATNAAASNQPEMMETVTTAVATHLSHRESTTSIGTVLALRSIALRNEVAGVVREVALTSGAVVEAGDVLVAFDVSVEEAELAAQEAHAAMAETTLQRLTTLRQDGAASDEEVDQARAERDVTLANIGRTRALIARKTVRAPFRARVGLADVHPGQYLNEGTQLTTLQGVDAAVHVDFAVSQDVAAGLRQGQQVSVVGASGELLAANIVAVDARVDPVTRNALVRARVPNALGLVSPGSSVRVVVPVGRALEAVAVPATAVRKGPGGDHVFVIAADPAGQTRAHMRPVRSGAMVGNEVVILEGLEAGEVIAAQGSFKLFESIAVNVAQADADASAGVGGSR